VRREEKWAEIIKGNYEEPSLLICGVGHVIKGFSKVGILRLLFGNVFNPLSLYAIFCLYHDKHIGYLGEFLRENDIELEIVGYLK
jgi:hypothetical protein